MPVISNTARKGSLRLTLYLHRKKHSELFEFLTALPEGTVSNFVRDVLQQYIQHNGFTTHAEPLKDQTSQGQALLPAATQLNALPNFHGLEALPEVGPSTRNMRP